MCQAIKVKRNRVEQCDKEAIFDDLCVFHYILAVRLQRRNLSDRLEKVLCKEDENENKCKHLVKGATA